MSDISNDLSTGSCTPAKEVEQSSTETNANIFRDKNVMNPQDAHDLLSKTLADRHSSKGQKLSIISSLRRFSNRNSSTLKQAPGECSKSFGGNFTLKERATNPQIVLEVISGRAATWIIITTYLVFVLCFTLDMYNTVQNLKNDNLSVVHGVQNCTYMEENGYSFGHKSSEDWGCVDHKTKTWRGFYPDVYDVLHIDFNYMITNFTATALPIVNVDDFYDSDTAIAINTRVQLWACFQADGCGTEFGPTALENENIPASRIPVTWQAVLDTKRSVYLVTPSGKYITPSDDNSDVVLQFFSIFQNQEALPTNSPIKSYFVELEMLNNASYAVLTNVQFSEAKFDLDWDHRTRGMFSRVTTIINIILFVATVAMMTIYIHLVQKYRVEKTGKTWLPEQKWFLAYAFSVVLYQNPVYQVQNLSVPSSGEALIALACSSASQVLLLVIWLLFADAISRFHLSKARFYGPKIMYGLVMFTSICVVLAYQFPSWIGETTRSPVLSTFNWPNASKNGVVVGSITFVSMFILWAFYWAYHLISTYKRLNILPYLTTRYHQLLFRFFFIQATLLGIYYVAQYGTSLYLVSHAHFYGYTSDGLADSINTLFRQQNMLFGRTVFITVYAFILGYLLLPTAVVEGEFSSILSAYAVDEEEKQEILTMRKDYIEKIKGKLVKLVNLADTADCVFCFSKALSLLEVSNAAYGDSTLESKEENHSFIKKMLDELGYTFIECVENEDYDSQVIAARNNTTQELVFAFRGTQTKKNMSDNLNYRKKMINFKKMKLELLDLEDDLHIDNVISDSRYVPAVEGTGGRATEVAGPDPRVSTNFLFNIFRRNEKDGAKATQSDVTDSTSRSGKRQSTGEGGQQEKFLSNVTDFFANGADILLDGIEGGANAIASGVKATSDTLIGASNLVIDGAKVIGTNIMDTTDKFNPFFNFNAGHDDIGIHRGFLGIYESLREDVHRIYRTEQLKMLTPVQITGHSMGGACAQLAALDLLEVSVPRVLHYYDSLKPEKWSVLEAKSTLHLTTFGSPRVGDPYFVKIMNKRVPDSFRVVVDGDIVPTVPRISMGFKHAGTQVLIDHSGGNCIIAPSFIERWLRMRKTSDLSTTKNSHFIASYRESMEAVVTAAKKVHEVREKVLLEGRTSEEFQTQVFKQVFEEPQVFQLSSRPVKGDSEGTKNPIPNANTERNFGEGSIRGSGDSEAELDSAMRESIALIESIHLGDFDQQTSQKLDANRSAKL